MRAHEPESKYLHEANINTCSMQLSLCQYIS